MNSIFPIKKLGKYVSIQGGYAYKRNDFCEEGVPVLKIKNVRNREIDFSDLSFVDRKTAEKTSRFFATPGDILISMTGSGIQAPNSIVGRVARFTKPENQFLINQRVGRFIIEQPDKLDEDYLFFLISQPSYQWYLVSVATGSANQVNISGQQIKSLDIPLPSLREQKSIAAVLSAFDDKIELNRQMNATLEEMAQALFKSWFVDFDPVRRNQEARLFPKSLASAAPYDHLFPDELVVDGNGRELPKGWKMGIIGDLVTERKEKNRDNEFSNVVSAVNSGELVASDEYFNKRVYSKDVSKYLKVYPFDFAYNPSRINIGSIGMLTDYEEGLVSPVYTVLHLKLTMNGLCSFSFDFRKPNS